MAVEPAGSDRMNIPQWKEARLIPVDALRGLIMVLMALDHANYFIAQKHSPGEYWGGPLPEYTNAIAFITRFVTHLSAPGFFFLMGVGIYLFAVSRRKRGWSEWAITQHFLIRGGFLIALQLILINRAWELGPFPFPRIYIGVLVALGGTMILGSLLFRLSGNYLLALALALFVGTELLHPDPTLWGRISNDPLNLVLLRSGGDGIFWVNYPILPWLELVTFGLLFGTWLSADPRKAIQRGLIMGLVFLVFFAILRSMNGFGNIRPREGDLWIDFLNVVKYPPSMTFTLLTMGINLSLLWVFARVGERAQGLLRALAVFGRVPLFVYIVHLYLYLLMGRLAAPNGISILSMLPYWLLGLMILYPLALWYGRFKAGRSPRSVLRML